MSEKAQHVTRNCPICGKGVVVSIHSIGTPHQFVSGVVHAECVEESLATKGKLWATENPEEAAQLLVWAKEPGESREAERR